MLDQQAALRSLLKARSRLLPLIWTIVRDAHLAEDVYQELLLKVVEHSPGFESEEQLHAWSRVVARNHAINLLKHRDRGPRILDEGVLELLEQTVGRMGGELETDVEALRSCLGRLSGGARRVLNLRYAQGLSGQEVAQRLGIKPHSVYVTLSRVYQQLAACIRRHRGERVHE